MVLTSTKTTLYYTIPIVLFVIVMVVWVYPFIPTVKCSPSQIATQNVISLPGPFGTKNLYYCSFTDFTTHSDLEISQVADWRDLRFIQLETAINELPTNAFTSHSANSTLITLAQSASKHVDNNEFHLAVIDLRTMETYLHGNATNLVISPYDKRILPIVQGIEHTTILAATTGVTVNATS